MARAGYHDGPEWLIFFIAVTFILGGLAYTGNAWNDCNEKGGQLVRGLFLYECIIEENE